MKRPVTANARWMVLVWLAGTVIAIGNPSLAQDPAASGRPAKGAAAKRGEKSSGRLPAYYGKVKVTPEQREKILAIQKEYAAKIDPLRKQLDALTKERDAKMEAVLTPEQQKQMEELKAAAKKSRGSRKAAEEKPAAQAPVEKSAGKDKQ
jgi:transketolase